MKIYCVYRGHFDRAAVATANTKHNKQGHPVISKDDEWAGESEWDDLFELLSQKRQIEK